MDPAVVEQFDRRLRLVVVAGRADEILVRAGDEFAQAARLALIVVVIDDRRNPRVDRRRD
jgi:hypothetical protein